MHHVHGRNCKKETSNTPMVLPSPLDDYDKFELGLGAWNNSVQLPIMQHNSNPEDEKNVFLEFMFNLTLEIKQDSMKLIQICAQYAIQLQYNLKEKNNLKN